MLKANESATAKPTVILVGADKGGVGKTMVTRTLIDYLNARQIPRRAFDTEAPKGNLKRFHPDITDIVDVTSSSDQMKVFDTITTGETTVIDVRAGLLSATLKMLREIGFLEAVKKGEYALTVLHILGPSISSLEEMAEAGGYLSGAGHFLVKNYINNATFFDWDPSTAGYFKRMKNARELTVPHLNELACEQVELAAVPFERFAANRTASGEAAGFSFVLRGYVRHWLSAVYAEYDRIGLIEPVNQKQKVA